ncbi:hypothetical protein JOM56_013440 [Amanita muscaria]
MDTSSGSNQVRLCKCPKCLRDSDDGIVLKQATYYRHAKYRNEETIARRMALFKQFGLEAPNASSSSTVCSSNRTRRRKIRAKTVHIPEPQAPPSDIDQELGEPLGNSLRGQDDLKPQNADMDDEMYRDLLHSPASPPPNHNPGEVPRLPEPASEPFDEYQHSSDDDSENGEMAARNDEEGDDDADENIELPFVGSNDPWPQPTLPKLILAKDMIENIKGACLEDDLDEEILAKL